MSKVVLDKLIYDMPSSEYHSTEGTFSSSQLKTMLGDEEEFYRKYILKTEKKEENTAFDVGSYFHTAVLEPHLVEKEFAFYMDGTRTGAKWEKFKADNPGKVILNQNEKKAGDGLISAVKNSPVAMGRIARGTPEVSCFTKLHLCGGEIVSFAHGKMLTKNGWADIGRGITGKKSTGSLVMKVRADLLGEDFILDLKSTSGNVKNEFVMRGVVSNFSYDLSMALYLDIFSLVTKVPKKEFVLTFASKTTGSSKSYIASESNIDIGRVKWTKAFTKLIHCINEKWAFEDSMGVINPSAYEFEHLKKSDTDLI